MKPATPALSALLALAAACTQPQYGIQSFAAQKPMYERHRELANGRYYVEVLGNGFASHRMLEEHFSQKGKELCREAAFSTDSERTTRLRGGQLEDIKMECGRWGCNADAANFPLVRGFVTCARNI